MPPWSFWPHVGLTSTGLQLSHYIKIYQEELLKTKVYPLNVIMLIVFTHFGWHWGQQENCCCFSIAVKLTDMNYNKTILLIDYFTTFKTINVFLL